MVKKYRWEDWFAEPSGVFTLIRDRDYSCSQSSMAQQVRSAAQRFQVGVTILDQDTQLTIQVKRRQPACDTI